MTSRLGKTIIDHMLLKSGQYGGASSLGYFEV